MWITGQRKSTDFKTQIVLADENIQTVFLGWEVAPIHFRAIKHLEITGYKSDATFFFVHRSRFEDSFPRPFWDWTQVLPSGKIPGFEDAGYRGYYQTFGDVFVCIDPSQKWAVWICWSENELPEWELAAPYRLLFQHWLKLKNQLLLHAASVAVNRKAVLLVGPGGKGKSTTSLACLGAGFQYLGDDFVVVNPNNFQVQSLYQSGKISTSLVAHFPEFLPFFNTKVAEKQCLFVGESCPDQLLLNANLVAVLVLDFQINNLDTRFSKCKESMAFKALIPNTMALLHEDLTWIQPASSLLFGLPCYQLQTGTDFVHIAKAVQAILMKENG